MAGRDNTSSARRNRSRSAKKPTRSSADPGATDSSEPRDISAVSPRSQLEETIEGARAQLLEIHGVLKCLHGVLLHAEGEDSACHAEAAHVAARLVDELAEQLDSVKLRPLLDAFELGTDSGGASSASTI